MKNNDKPVLPFDRIFPACKEVMDTILCPINYTELTLKALRLLKVSESEIDFSGQAEDVREKMLLRRWHNTVFYVPYPHCLGGVVHWFQPGFNLDEPMVIPGNVSSAITGAYEALRREMVIKNPNASLETILKTKARGLVLEAIVKDWFKDNWPDLYRPPENHEQWDRPCNHDFILLINDKPIKLDIAGPNKNGTYGNQAGKKVADIHLICDLTGDGAAIEWKAAVSGNGFKNEIIPELCLSPLKIIVWLNCHQKQLDYEVIRRYALKGDPHATH